MLVHEALKAKGIPYRMTHYRDGVEALHALTGGRAELPDAMVIDLNMPRMGGLEVLGKMRERSDLRSVPVAILTSSLQVEEREAAYRLGAQCFVRKPVDLYDFLEQVGQALQSLLDGREKGWPKR